MARPGGQEQPLTRAELDRLALDVQHCVATEDDYPLVLLLSVVHSGVSRAGDDLFDHDVADACQLVSALARCRGRSRSGQTALRQEAHGVRLRAAAYGGTVSENLRWYTKALYGMDHVVRLGAPDA